MSQSTDGGGLGCLIVIILIVVGIGSCIAGGDEYFKEEEYKNVQELLMHETRNYTLVSLDEQGKANLVKFHVDWRYHADNLGIFFDVNDREPQYAKLRWRFNKPTALDTYSATVVSGEIHLHRNGKIGGAGWNHGKFGSGRTNVVE